MLYHHHIFVKYKRSVCKAEDEKLNMAPAHLITL